ncbi:mannose/glucose-specific lectin-like [Triticum dicoccoides]|uniref:mannose/glucose-specific lectin-like n=1 Tax=Triticum dicoccoides TaxID=85692 RepID=UPI000E7B226A|nr:mannose/glucose-specific lectin-like [Triticum dicoccoides]
MANPSNFQITPRAAIMESNELNFRSLYLFHTSLGANQTQSTVIDPNATTGLGQTAVNNWAICDSPSPGATVVARAQGLHIYAGNWQNIFSITFEVERFKGSTLQVMGISVEEGEWAIVGGTGQFAMANGVIYKKFHEQRSDGNIIELTVHAFCTVLNGSPSLLTKLGPWGGSGGSDKDIVEAPRRLESITVSSGLIVDSIKFSYVDQAGQKHTGGPWGGSGGNQNTIVLGASEFVKEVSGTHGIFDKDQHHIITSLKFITNVKAYGPFGEAKGTPFTIPAEKNSSIVGFFGRSGIYLDALGVYVSNSS